MALTLKKEVLPPRPHLDDCAIAGERRTRLRYAFVAASLAAVADMVLHYLRAFA